jgi:hypothetical protein
MGSANVKAVEALQAMRSMLLKFKSEALNSLYAMQAESRRTIEWLEERQRYWQRTLQHWIGVLQEAQAALAGCASQGGDCSQLVAMVQLARRKVEEAEERLRTVQLHLKRVLTMYQEFEREARRLNALLGQELMQGAALLERSHATLLAYLKGGGVELEVAPNTTIHLKDIKGQDVLVVGDPKEYAGFNHKQGERVGYRGTCGLVSCQDILLQFGLHVTETEIVNYAIEHGLCNTEGEPRYRGGTTNVQRAEILRNYGIPARDENSATLVDLSSYVQQGRGVIIAVNAGILWAKKEYLERGDANHAIVVTGVKLDSSSGVIEGFYINDSGTNESGKFIDAITMLDVWENLGGLIVMTDIGHTS